MKKYIIYAGVNGAGKSTFYHSWMQEDLPRVNTDEMVHNLGSWKDPKLQSQAGIMAVKNINEYFLQGISFTQETTLCGHSIMKNIQKAKKIGYRIEMHYIGVSGYEIAVERVAQRVSRGGHGVPSDVIKRRYENSLENLCKAIPLCDKLTVYDNSDYFVKIAELKNGKLTWENESLQAIWFKEKVLSKLKL